MSSFIAPLPVHESADEALLESLFSRLKPSPASLLKAALRFASHHPAKLSPQLLVSALQRKPRCSGCGPGSRNLLATIHRSNSNSHFPTNGLGIFFWRFAADMGCGHFVIAGSDATR